jgi:hypothetical protein
MEWQQMWLRSEEWLQLSGEACQWASAAATTVPQSCLSTSDSELKKQRMHRCEGAALHYTQRDTST